MVLRARIRLLFLITALTIASSPAFSNDRIQRTVAATEAFLPLAFLMFQGADTAFELGVLGGSVLLHTLPNGLMLIAESGGYPQLTRISRWVNFGIDSGTAAALLGVGLAYLAGTFGPEPDIRSRGAVYLALSIPAGIAAFADFLPYSAEGPLRDAREAAAATVPAPEGQGEAVEPSGESGANP